MTETATATVRVRRTAGSWIRRCHRWIAAVFTVTVVITFIALALPEPMVWVSYLPLLPLGLLMISGSYLFLLPHVRRFRSR
ncbi:MAG TPA: hypothetical protein VK020_12590 [Microlunatus sp.]|nr:hypothetical protein [Microlunatus sp.]